MSAIPNPVRVSVEEYLRTGYSPDCDYVDGEVQERNLGEFDHAFLQGLLVQLFLNRGLDWGVLAVPEQRLQLMATRFRVPDVCVLRRGEPREQIVTRPPLIVIEILSPEDTLRRIQQKVADYLAFGIGHVWVIDPGTRKAYVCSRRGFEEPATGELTVPGTAIRVVLADLFAELDRA